MLLRSVARVERAFGGVENEAVKWTSGRDPPGFPIVASPRNESTLANADPALYVHACSCHFASSSRPHHYIKREKDPSPTMFSIRVHFKAAVDDNGIWRDKWRCSTEQTPMRRDPQDDEGVAVRTPHQILWK